ncbi:hypothetical protein CYMTET_54613 [Cymbomonas tetramitiformis]|uniref:Ammonium transporter AmtB-like domain-containing protein n=1 Tax=Cymbomonas tetramitiformis TaxID=36881 RepID=A0AAE0BFU5_9CHLO|nr:hypothetical protein CYMTET_54613 [Cymbomonas tetramitiformis]
MHQRTDASSDSDTCGRQHRIQSDNSFLLSSGWRVLAMQGGFALLEASSVNRKSAANIMMKNLVDLSLGAIAWFLFGWGLSFGPEAQSEELDYFVGSGQFALADADDWALWFFQFSFAATSATIISGSVAGRMKFFSYVVCSFFITAFIYPPVVHWAWSESGWLAKKGFKDFAGSGVVHLLGGTAAFVAAYHVGPRDGRFLEEKFYKGLLKVKLQLYEIHPEPVQSPTTHRAPDGENVELCEEEECLKSYDVAVFFGKDVKVLHLGAERLFEKEEIVPTFALRAHHQVVPLLTRQQTQKRTGNKITRVSRQQQVETQPANIFFALRESLNMNSNLSFEVISYDQQPDAVVRTMSSSSSLAGLRDGLNQQGTVLIRKSELERSLFLEYKATIIDIPPSSFMMGNTVNKVFGTMVLWVGWYSFNCGSALGLSEDRDLYVSLIAVNTTLAAAGGCVGGAIVSTLMNKGKVEINPLCHGCLGGLVGVTAGCNMYRPVDALMIGLLASPAVLLSDYYITNSWQLDDPVSAVAVHAVAGCWGCIAVGLFGRVNECSDFAESGLFYGGGFSLLGAQLIGVLSILAWITFWMSLIMVGMKKTIGLRVSAHEEELGLDLIEHNLRGMYAEAFENASAQRPRTLKHLMTQAESEEWLTQNPVFLPNIMSL